MAPCADRVGTAGHGHHVQRWGKRAEHVASDETCICLLVHSANICCAPVMCQAQCWDSEDAKTNQKNPLQPKELSSLQETDPHALSK